MGLPWLRYEDPNLETLCESELGSNSSPEDHNGEEGLYLISKRKRGMNEGVVRGEVDMLVDVSKNEKRGGAPHPMSLLLGFNEALRDCGLIDLGMKGYPFTWERGRGSTDWVEERLDRAVATDAWLALFPRACVLNIDMRSSDHSALLLRVTGTAYISRIKRFRFENAWLQDERFKDTLIQIWSDAAPLSLPEKLAFCGKRLQAWGGDCFQKFGKRKRELSDRIRKF
ncbi:unnamed protein product [Cuscuta campestris]|uniref:Endonuclease/exonuclease/phosphatase domain-containing protein n=1 Tax=Cuscuta campestris TaxID=132261 RepID=A0A484L5E6_9ASTE|nr:unnamed protein product [Cuscuta campestris]